MRKILKGKISTEAKAHLSRRPAKSSQSEIKTNELYWPKLTV